MVAALEQVDYYELLAVAPDADFEAVSAAFTRQFALWGDRAQLPTRADRAYAEWVLELLYDANRVLGDPAGRERYHAARRPLSGLESADAVAVTWHDRAQHFLDEDNPSAAKRVAQEAATQLPGRPLPWLLRGYASALNGEYADADFELAEAARLLPHLALPRYLQGELYAAQQKWEAALARYEEALALRPDSAPMLAAKAEALLATGDYPAGAWLLEPLVRRHPGDVLYASTLARAYYQLAVGQLTPIPDGSGRRIWTNADHIRQLHETATRIEQLHCTDPEVDQLAADLHQFADEGTQVQWDTSAPSIYIGLGIFLFLWGCGLGFDAAESVGMGIFLGLLISIGVAGGLFALLRRKPAWKLAAQAVGKGNLSAQVINTRNRVMGAVYRTLNS